jgi:hypothetical protein
MSQADESVVDFHMEDESQWVGVTGETKTELDVMEKAGSHQLVKRKNTRSD